MSVIELSDAKAWLRYPDPSAPSSDDAGIQSVIDAAEQIIEAKVGVCTPKIYDELYTPNGSCKVWLRNTPVLEVMSVVESWDVVSFDLADQPSTTGAIIGGTGNEPTELPATDLWAYSLDEPLTGEVTRRGPMNVAMPFFPSDRGLHIIYRAGRNPMPPAIQLAAKELVAHIWQNAELRSMAQSNQFVQYDTVSGQGIDSMRPDTAASFWVGVPNRIIALLESEMTRLPFMA